MSALKLEVLCQLVAFVTTVLSSDTETQGIRHSDHNDRYGEATELAIQLPDSLSEDEALPQHTSQLPSLRGAGVVAKTTPVETSREKSHLDKSPGAWTREISFLADVQDTSEVSKHEAAAKFEVQEARFEAAQATADQMAAEAIATEELRKADKAAARTKAAWVKVRKAEEDAISLSSGFEAVQSQRARLSLMSGADAEIPAAVPGNVQVQGALPMPQVPAAVPGQVASPTPDTTLSGANNANSTGSGCNTASKVSCPVQQVLTFNYVVPLVPGIAEWVGLALLWLGSLYMASSMCDCCSGLFCFCQLLSCSGIAVLAVGTTAGFLKPV